MARALSVNSHLALHDSLSSSLNVHKHDTWRAHSFATCPAPGKSSSWESRSSNGSSSTRCTPDRPSASAESASNRPLARDKKQKLTAASGRPGGGLTTAGRAGGAKIPFELEAVISNLVSLAPRGSISRCMETFKGKLTLQDFALIFKEFAQRGDWIRAMRLFKYMQRQQWCTPNEHIYTILIGIMGREGMLDRAQELFEEMPEHGVEWNVYSFTALINAYGRNGMYERSLDLLSRMKREGIPPNRITYNTVLNACAKGALQWDGLVDIFAQMRQEGVQPDLVTFNTLLAACSARSLVEESAMVFRSMVASRVPPNALSYASLVDTHRRGRLLGGVRSLFTEMAEEEGVVADVGAYNMLIDAYAWSGDYRTATQVFSEMQIAGCAPDVATYTALLKALGSHGCYDEVRTVFTQMKASGRRPDIATYQALMDVFISGGYFREASQLFLDMVEDGVAMDERAFASLLLACGLGGLTSEATEIYRHMREQSSVPPSPAVFEAVVAAYGQAAMYDDALVAVHEAIDMGATDQPGPFHALMEAYASGGLYDDAAFTFALMVQQQQQHQQSSQSAATAAAAAAAATTSFPGSPFNSSRSSPSSSPPPSSLPSSSLHPADSATRTFNALTEAFTRGGLVEEAVRVNDDMKDAGCYPTLATHTAMVAAFCSSGSFESAYAQTVEMREEGIMPPAGCYCQLMALCARRGRWADMRRLLVEMEADEQQCQQQHQQQQQQLQHQQQGLLRSAEEHRMVRGLLLGRYESSEFWPVAEDFFTRRKREGISANRQLINSLLDLLWSAGRRATATKMHKQAKALGIFPEATFKSQALCSLDVHRMSQGAASVFLYQWLSDLQETAALEPEDLPPLYSIVTRWGDAPSNHDESEAAPVVKAMGSAIRSLGLPFTPAQWHAGRLVSDRSALEPWLLAVGGEGNEMLTLVDVPLPQEVFSKKGSVE